MTRKRITMDTMELVADTPRDFAIDVPAERSSEVPTAVTPSLAAPWL